ncbi:MAG TPA: caspase family protein [Ferruginibacter sp.]|jgi:hypothetical protein|nr:caspase family protein [Ferruginibacter sp.]
MKYIFSFIAIIIFLNAYGQKPSFHLNEGLISDHPIIINKKNWMICYPVVESYNSFLNNGRVTIWDITSGSVVLNIAIENRDINKVYVSDSEKYLIIDFDTEFLIYDLDDLNNYRTLSKAQYNHILKIDDSKKILFGYTNEKIWKIDLADQTDNVKLLNQSINQFDNTEEIPICGDRAFVSNQKDISIIDLENDSIIREINQDTIYGNKDYSFITDTIYPVDKGRKLIVLAKRKNVNDPSKYETVMIYYDIDNNKKMYEASLGFLSDGHIVFDDTKEQAIILENSNENSNEGCKFANIRIQNSKLIIQQHFFSGIKNLDFLSYQYLFFKYGTLIYVDHYKTLHAYNVDKDKYSTFEITDSGSLILKAEIIDKDIVYFQINNISQSSVTPILLNSSNGTYDTLVNSGATGFFTVLKNPIISNYNIIYIAKDNTYKFANYDNKFRRTDSWIIKNNSIQIRPEIVNNTSNIITAKLNFNSQPSSVVNLFNYNLSTGEVKMNSKSNDVEIPDKNNAYFTYTYSKKWAAYNLLDSFYLHDASDGDIISKGLVKEFSTDADKHFPFKYISNIVLSNNKSRLLIYAIGLYEINIVNGRMQLLRKVQTPIKGSLETGFCNNANSFYDMGYDSIYFYDYNSANFLYSTANRVVNLAGNYQKQISEFNGTLIVNNRNSKQIKLININKPDNSISLNWPSNDWMDNNSTVGISDFDSVSFAYMPTTGNLWIINTQDGKIIWKDSVKNIVPGFFNTSSNFIYFNSSGTPVCVDYKKNTFITFSTNLQTGIISDFFWKPKDSILISASVNNIFTWNINTKKLNSNIIISDTTNYFVQDNDGYYKYNKSEAGEIRCLFNNEVAFPQQLDLIYNRPDKFIQDSVLKSIYFNIYKQRLRNYGLDENNLTINKILNKPITRIFNTKNTNSNITSKRDYTIHCQCLDKNSKIIKVFGYINDVCVFHYTLNDGITIFDSLVTMSLTTGKNDIKMYCINDQGIESNYAIEEVYFKPIEDLKSKVYFVGIGVNNYQDTSKDLHYSTKDIRDLAKEFKIRFPQCEIDTLIDKEVTIENIKALKQKLQKSDIEDKVIISVSGHGLLDNTNNFYFATYDVNFNDPATRGLSYDDLEGLLDDIPARKRLLMIDACHSGEVDKDVDINITDTSKGLKVFGRGVGYGVKKNSIDLQTSFELMKDIFADISKNNGAVIISAAGGLECALENAEYDNGIFTYCVKKALLDREADKNGDGEISVNELKEYVSAQVEELTHGLQKPTTRSEILDFDWQVW